MNNLMRYDDKCETFEQLSTVSRCGIFNYCSNARIRMQFDSDKNTNHKQNELTQDDV